MSGFWPLVEVECSDDMKPFLCSMFAPHCIDGQPEPPSKEACQSAYDDCNDILTDNGFTWPDIFDCNTLPGSLETEEAATEDPSKFGEFLFSML